MALHPIKTTKHIRDSYIRYLKTIKTFQDGWLRSQFSAAIETKDALVKGPILEASPPFVKTVSIKDLVKEGILSIGFNDLCSESLPYERLLYKHQEIAIRKILNGRNIVVSTGTGSGKTEAFLIPILNHLLKEENAGSLSNPGVRAMFLYPLNALANDQMKRLRRVLKDYPQITFGRYIGETEYTRKKARELFEEIYPEEPDLENELLSRNEMQKSPPHIFLTNYAMLEYLLLRPDDSVFFDGDTANHWSFIVLDEAHSYDGAKANEIGMLMRRLEQRVVGGNISKLQGIATSATIGGGAEDFPKVVKFAEGLFNLPFEWNQSVSENQDIVKSSRLPTSTLGKIWGSGYPSFYQTLKDMADRWRSDKEFHPLNENYLEGIPNDIQIQLKKENNTPQYLYNLLKGDQKLHYLLEELNREPQFLNELAENLFSDYKTDVGELAVANLVSAAVLAKSGYDLAPLLPARYHIFARALEGAFICLNYQAHQKGNENDPPNLFLSRHRICPHCGSRVFELANCTRCGTAYLIGEIMNNTDIDEKEWQLHNTGRTLVQNSTVYEAAVRGKRISYFVLDVNDIASIDEDAIITSTDSKEQFQEDPELESMELCPVCGSIRGEFEMWKCSCEAEPIIVQKIDVGRKRTLQRCVSCSTRASRGVVYRFLTGQDAPVSVLADALYQYLPSSTKPEMAQRPGNGRKLLNFTDSRQKAAFFAPYVERTHNRDLRRCLIIQTIFNDPESRKGNLRLADLVPRILRKAKKVGLFPGTLSDDAKRRKIAIWLMKEFSPLDRRLSLEGVGLIRFKPVIDPEWEVPEFLTQPPWNLNQIEAYSLILMLLDTLRLNGVITYLRSESEDLVIDEAFSPRNKAIYVRRRGAEKRRSYNVLGWNPAEGYSNSRVNLLVRVLNRRKGHPANVKEHAQITLLNLWEYITSKNTPWGQLLIPNTKQDLGVLYRLRHDMWKVIPSLDGDIENWYICDRCLNISSIKLEGVCKTYGCGGSLTNLSEKTETIQENLYRNTYLGGVPIPLKAEEHTAQWVTRKAAEVQNRFIKGEVNLLSCSTTFELGVDVGDLQAVLMRNVPPSTANYVQRAGRAGRRTDSVALALTFAQRRPHDLNHYKNPKKMVSGEIKPPVTVLQNEKIVRRHLHSVAFAAFLRWAKDKHSFEYRKTGKFFENAEGNQAGINLLREYLSKNPITLKKALNQVLPIYQYFAEVFSIETWGWLEGFTNDKKTGILDIAEAEFNHEIDEFEKLKKGAAFEEKYYLAGRYKKILKQIRRRSLFGYLGNRNVLPKYGFPTDVVTLKTDHLQGIPQASQIDLSRDLRMAISEFAPGSQVIAAKKIWHSAGLRKIPKQQWVHYKYAVCPECEKMKIKVGENKPTRCSCGNLFSKSKRKGTFIVPEHGFIASKKTTRPGENPPKVFYSSRVYFASYGFTSDGYEENNGELDNIEVERRLSANGIKVDKSYSKHGWLALVNNGYGSGFAICNYCGYSIPYMGKEEWKKNHRNPLTDKECDGEYSIYHLGHRFMTDVMELRLDYPFEGNSEIYSFLYAILDGASIELGLQREDIEGTVYFRKEGPSFVIYDNVPGGAGHVERVYDSLPFVFTKAYDLVFSCECGVETSCYNCLRNYRNQHFHNILARGKAAKLLGKIIGVNNQNANILA